MLFCRQALLTTAHRLLVAAEDRQQNLQRFHRQHRRLSRGSTLLACYPPTMDSLKFADGLLKLPETDSFRSQHSWRKLLPSIRENWSCCWLPAGYLRKSNQLPRANVITDHDMQFGIMGRSSTLHTAAKRTFPKKTLPEHYFVHYQP